MPKHNHELDLPVLGWREWVRLPELGLPWIKAKTDTGARTSALHAQDIVVYERDGREYVRFTVHPKQGSLRRAREVEAELIGRRHVRSSGGKATFRPVIRTVLEIMDRCYKVEFTLICRKKMKFRMLLGREALRHRFVVDAGRSYACGRKPLKGWPDTTPAPHSPGEDR